MYNAGDFNTTETVNIPLNSFSSDDPSASVTITDLAAGDIEIHKDGSITQRSSDNGVTVSINFDGVTGNHMIHIDLSDNTDAGFYSSGSRYLVRIEGATVDAGTVNAWVGGFSIDCVLRPTTAGRTLDVSATGEAGLDFDNIKDATGAHTLTNITVPVATTVGTCTTNTDMRGTDGANTTVPDAAGTAAALIGGLENISSAAVTAACTSSLNSYDPPTKAEMDIGHGLLATEAKQDIIGSNVDSILTDTGTTIPAQISALENISSADVISACTSSLNTYDPPTKAEMDNKVDGLNDFDPVNDTVANVTLVGTCTTNSDMRGTDNAALASVCTEARLAELGATNIPADIDTLKTGVTVTTNSDKTGYSLSAAGIDSIHDEVFEGTVTLRQAVKLFLAVLTGKSGGGGTATLVFRDIGDTKNRLSVTVDSNGNRTAVGTRDGS